VDAEPAAEVSRIAPTIFGGYRIRSNVDLIRRSLNAIVATLAEGWDIGEIVEAMSDAEHYAFRKGIEAVGKLRAALEQTDVEKSPDRLNQGPHRLSKSPRMASPG
jgi:hypothetical protein